MSIFQPYKIAGYVNKTYIDISIELIILRVSVLLQIKLLHFKFYWIQRGIGWNIYALLIRFSFSKYWRG